MKGTDSYNSANNGAGLSFSNGNGPLGGGKTWPAEVDWQANGDDTRLLYHWGVMP